MDNPALLVGIIMMIGGFGFKMGAGPVPMWGAGGFERAPTTGPAFLFRARKGGGVAPIVRGVFTALRLPGRVSDG